MRICKKLIHTREKNHLMFHLFKKKKPKHYESNRKKHSLLCPSGCCEWVDRQNITIRGETNDNNCNWSPLRAELPRDSHLHE